MREILEKALALGDKDIDSNKELAVNVPEKGNNNSVVL